ncbi:hypothetical protein H9L17_07570 [Thermomonas brevis]|uniref:Uncharacterized protein n=1 Tax=Thermomonas brevis TaxID=215691 RepID=A0A7G9QX93_9GAMM|nr:hypothetical protein [Thermomonas brevis]QNN47968.1 hypothetical protein H9L17_07570 [Thermomonas brevis]
MSEPIRIDAVTLQILINRAERLHAAAFPPADCGRVDVPRELDAVRQRLNAQREEHLQPWFVLLDEGIQFFIQFERYLYEVPPSSNLMSYAVTISKLKRDLVSIRELLAFGQDMAANVLARTFIENIEIAMALALDAATCEAFAHTTDTNAFWNKHIGYGRVYEQMLQYSAACDVDDARARQLVERHKEAKKLFSDSTHGGRESSLFTAFSPSLTNSDEVHFLSLGAHTYHTQFLALFVAQEIQAFAGSIVKGTMSRNPLHLYRGFKSTGRFMNAAASAHVLQELLARYETQLESSAAT